MTCQHCGSELPIGAMFCGECGRAVSRVPDSVTCESCGARMSPVDIFCGECGHVARSAAMTRMETGAQPTVILDPLPPVEDLVAPGSEISLDTPPAPLQRMSLAADVEDTRIVRGSSAMGRSGARFILQFSTGESITVGGTGLIGRNPTAEPGERFDNLVRILDLTRSVSKTHLQFGDDAGEFWISDRFSGNGTVLRPPEASAHRAEAGKRYRVARGSRIDIGEQFFVVS